MSQKQGSERMSHTPPKEGTPTDPLLGGTL